MVLFRRLVLGFAAVSILAGFLLLYPLAKDGASMYLYPHHRWGV